MQLKVFFSSVTSLIIRHVAPPPHPPLPSVSAVGLFFSLQTPWADSRCDLSPVLLCTLPGLLLFLLRLSGWSCMLCGQLRGSPMGVGGRLAFPRYSHGAAAENAPECISSIYFSSVPPMPQLPHRFPVGAAADTDIRVHVWTVFNQTFKLAAFSSFFRHRFNMVSVFGLGVRLRSPYRGFIVFAEQHVPSWKPV